MQQAIAKSWPVLTGYEILGEISRTATSVVYQAREASLQRIVAIKLITAGDYASPRHIAGLRAELDAVARLQHPCITPIYAVGEDAGRLYVVMEYVDGGSLEHKLRGKPQSPSGAAQIVETLARTIAYVHEQKLIHGNLKPSNILLTAEGLPKLTDFAMARTAERSTTQNPDGMIGGDPSYIAPEHLARERAVPGRQRSAGAATDIYALGAILFEMLTGRPPFLGATPADTVKLARHADPLSPQQLQLRV